jgi:hypothetical protein
MTTQNLALLNQAFPKDILEQKELGGRTFDFVPHSFVTARLNEALGVGGWSFEARETQWVKELDTVLVLGRLTAHINGERVVKEQWGGQIINRKKVKPDGTPGDIVELTNDFKGATSDALRKCASLLGVGEELYMNGHKAPKQEQTASHQQSQPVAPPKPAAPAQPASNGPARKQDPESAITEPQIKRLWAIARGAGYSDEEIKGCVLKAGYQSSKEIKVKDYDMLVSFFEQNPKAKSGTEG